jgi:hypothetical protein
MKTQDAAKALTQIATALRGSSFETIEELAEAPRRRVDVHSVDVPRALSMLVALSSFDKSQWLEVISEYGFPIQVRPRDASRDILGKLLNYLEANPDARDKLATSGPRLRSHTSPELAQALQFLLKP